MVYSGIKYIHIVVQPSCPSISRTFLSFQTEALYSLNSNSLFSPASPVAQVSPEKLKIAHVTCILFLLDSAILEDFVLYPKQVEEPLMPIKKWNNMVRFVFQKGVVLLVGRMYSRG